MPFAVVETIPRPEDWKAEFAASITNILCEELGVEPVNVAVFFRDLEQSNVSVAGVLSSRRKRD